MKENIKHILDEMEGIEDLLKSHQKELTAMLEKNNNGVQPYKNWQYIVIHHSATFDGIFHDWEAIRKYHKEVRGWRDIGYNFGIENISNKYVYRIGRPLNISGAHVRDMNSKAIGICAVGNYDIIEVPDQVWNMTLNITKILQSMFNIPTENVIGHREAYGILGQPVQKTCPGDKFNLSLFREQLKDSQFDNFFSPRRKNTPV